MNLHDYVYYGAIKCKWLSSLQDIPDYGSMAEFRALMGEETSPQPESKLVSWLVS